MGKAGGGLMRVEINLVMSEKGPMQQALKSEAAYSSYANPTIWGASFVMRVNLFIRD